MIASVAFRNFKALRNTSLVLGPFNLVIGPNGSGKTSLIQALLRLRTLSKLPLREPVPESARDIMEGPELTFRFTPPHDGIEAIMGCVSDSQCDLLQVVPLPSGEGAAEWPELRTRLMQIRSYIFDHHAMSAHAPARQGAELSISGGNLGPYLVSLRTRSLADFAALEQELCRILPEYVGFECTVATDGMVELALRLADGQGTVVAENVSQGTLYLLAMLALAHDPQPPSVICVEEIDRGIHPRLLRDIVDVLYRLSYPQSFGLSRVPVQIIATTHSPYMLDLFRDHPEEIVVSEKHGTAAQFFRLTDRQDLQALLQEGGTLGDMWFAGILGGVPQEKK